MSLKLGRGSYKDKNILNGKGDLHLLSGLMASRDVAKLHYGKVGSLILHSLIIKLMQRNHY